MSKYWARGIPTKVDFLFFEFRKFFNAGISFGQFSETEPFIRIVFLSLFFGIMLLFAVLVIFYFFNKKNLFSVRLTLLIFVAGISGNGLDRILFGKVTDFIILKPVPYAVFNVADIFIAFFGLSSIFLFFKKNEQIWYVDNLRTFKIIDKSFQLAFASKLLILTFFSNFLMAIFSYTVFNVLFDDSPSKTRMMGYIIMGFLAISVLFAVISFLFGLIVSHRSAGPVYALERFLGELKDDSSSTLKLREQDYHTRLVTISEKIKDLIKLKNGD